MAATGMSAADLPQILPAVQEIHLTEGVTELSADVRLSTSNVLPFMRKTMRGVLSAVNIRVVANKKRFVINVNIVEPTDLELGDVPDISDYYQMDICDNVVTIESASQIGATWGALSFASIYASAGPDTEIPNCRVRDWAAVGIRGIVVPAGWESAVMRLDDWTTLMDRLVSVKLNTLAVGLTGAVAGGHGWPDTDVILPAIPDLPDAGTTCAAQWYSPDNKSWNEEVLQSAMHTEDFLAGVATAARERGLLFIPSFDPFALNRVVATAAGLDASQLADPRLREALEHTYGTLWDVNFQDQVTTCHLELLTHSATKDDIDLTSAVAQDFLVWLLDTLTSKGVKQFLIHAAEPAVAETYTGNDFAERLAAANLSNSVIRHVPPTSATPDAAVWLSCDLLANPGNTAEIELVTQALQEDPGHLIQGVLAYSTMDTVLTEREIALASMLWNPRAQDSFPQRALNRARMRFGDAGEAYVQAAAALNAALVAFPGELSCRPGELLTRRAVSPVPSPQAQLEDATGAVAVAIQAARDASGDAASRFTALLTPPPEDASERRALESWLAASSRLNGVASAYLNLLNGDKKAARAALIEGMETVENKCARYLTPVLLRGMSAVLKACE